MIGAVTPTAGGVLLTGGADGIFLALDQRDGGSFTVQHRRRDRRWRVDLYDRRRQYVAVAAGGYGLSSYGVVGSPAVFVFALPRGAK